MRDAQDPILLNFETYKATKNISEVKMRWSIIIILKTIKLGKPKPKCKITHASKISTPLSIFVKLTLEFSL